tara:strand:+ start:358 stop:915 length:558 start_codon:yes stop_codon:yes gene_type:complete
MKLLFENWRQYLGEQKAAVLFPDWLLQKLERVHSKPGQGSIFAKAPKEVAAMIQDIAANEGDIDKIATTTGMLTKRVPGIGYDLVAKVVNGQPVDKNNQPIQGELTTVQKEEGREQVQVRAIKTNQPFCDFITDDLTVIVRPMKDDDGNPKPGEYIILSAFPGTTGADKRASEWGDEYVVILPQG